MVVALLITHTHTHTHAHTHAHAHAHTHTRTHAAHTFVASLQVAPGYGSVTYSNSSLAGQYNFMVDEIEVFAVSQRGKK